MIDLIIGNVDYSTKLLDDFKENFTEILDNGNCFLSLANTRHRNVLAQKQSLSFVISNISTAEKDTLVNAVCGIFEASFNGIKKMYFCEKKDCTLFYVSENNNYWEVALTIEEA